MPEPKTTALSGPTGVGTGWDDAEADRSDDDVLREVRSGAYEAARIVRESLAVAASADQYEAACRPRDARLPTALALLAVWRGTLAAKIPAPPDDGADRDERVVRLLDAPPPQLAAVLEQLGYTRR